MKKIISILMIVMTLLSCATCITSCTDDDNCPICGGSGYYQKKDCPGC